MLSSGSSALAQLPPRPPTPPREVSKAVDDAIAFLDDSNEVDRLLSGSKPLPEISDSAVQGPQPSSQERAVAGNGTKKVGFTLQHVDIDCEVSETDPSRLTPIARRLSAGKNAKPVRSILKLTYPPLPPTPDSLRSDLHQFSPDIPGSFAKMLQSIIQQLAGPSRTARLDAYLAINGVLKTYDGVPDIQAMAQRMELFMQFLTRDMSWKDPEGNLDVNIITQALKLTNTILSIHTLAEVLDTDFKACLVDRSISVFEQSDIPKAVMKAHLVVAAQQRFYSNMLSTGRAEKLLAALKSIEERCSGNGVIAARMMIYLRMIEHSAPLMLAKIGDWIEHVFHGMLSSIKEVRCRAIDTCTEAGLTFGDHLSAAKALHMMLVTEFEDGQTYFDFLIVRLIELIADPEVGPCIPQIWSAVILFFRSKRMPVAKWPKLKSWLTIIQRCLNSSDMVIRHQAMLAWDKFVFAVMPDASTDSICLSMLKVPIVPGLSKRGNDKQAQQARQQALDSYCNLLHYCLRPGLSREELDVAWNIHVLPILSELLKSGSEGRHTACRVLYGMFNGNTGVWNAHVAMEQLTVRPEDLPRLDPRWVRSRLDKILTVIERILAAEMHTSLDASNSAEAAWPVLMQSVADAGSQEVKTSQELKRAIALLINMFRKLWAKRAQRGHIGILWLKRYIFFAERMVNCLGAAPFAEDILVATKDDNIEVAQTPSQKHSKQAARPQSPLMILLQQFLSPPGGLDLAAEYTNAISGLLRRQISSRTTRAERLSMLDHCLQLLSPTRGVEVEYNAGLQIWTAIARTAVDVLHSSGLKANIEESQHTGQALRHAFNVLAAGLPFLSNHAAFVDVEKLFHSINEVAIACAGDGGSVLAAVEPFSKALTECGQIVTLHTKVLFACYILEQAVWPKSRQSLDLARKSLWGVATAPHKSNVFDPFEHVYALINDLAASAYQGFGNDQACNSTNVQRTFTATVDFLDKSPLSLLGLALRKTQPGLSVWIQDELRKTGVTREASELIFELWPRVKRLLRKMPSKGSELLRVAEQIIVAGLSSPHKAVVNDCIVFWNETFENEESLEYPSDLERVLRARAVDAEIALPTFPVSDANNSIASLPPFFEVQSQLSPMQAVSTNASHVPATVFKSTHSRDQQSPVQRVHKFSSPAGRAARKSTSVTPKPRLRHDNSQIQFAPIETSPLPSVDESQLLTEHQKEVKNRQHKQAHIFQDFSSSPAAQSTLARGVSKRLDFKSNLQQKELDGAQVTPSGLIEGAGLMSDDLPSSPTPSSGHDACHQPLNEEDDDDDMDTEDPPSSPPQMSREPEILRSNIKVKRNLNGLDDSTVDITDFAVDGNGGNTDRLHGHEASHDDVLGEQNEGRPDLPSDSILPTMQLQQEEEASVRQSLGNDEREREGTALLVEDKPNHDHAAEKPSGAEAGDEDVTRIENSFIETTERVTDENSQSSNIGQQSQGAGKKRKRSSTSGWSSKKRKQQSPFKRLTTYLLGNSQEEDDDDIGDEIVVASSQRSSSPISQTVGVLTDAPADRSVDAMVKQEIEEIPMQPVKRSRGRPKKSEKVTATQLANVNTLKRKASALNNASDSEEGVAPLVGEEASALENESPPGTPSRRITRKTATAVVVNNLEPSGSDLRTETDESLAANPAHDEAAVMGAPEQVDVAQARPIATPRSILRRLHDALADFGEMILGSQEEREFDDVLFALRREVHEAGRRGRDA